MTELLGLLSARNSLLILLEIVVLVFFGGEWNRKEPHIAE